MKIGLALSGGGARGIAHLGILRAMEEREIAVDAVSGASVGAIIGALYAHGMRAADILDVILSTRIFSSLRPAWTLSGLLSMERIRSLLLNVLSHDSFDKLRLPLTVVATDLQLGKPRYFSSGPLVPPLLASSCVPGMFNPIILNESTFVDGGITDNFPVGCLRDQCDFIIGLHCNPVIPAPPAKNFRGVLERTLLLAINSNAERSKASCDMLIEPPDLGRFSTLELARARELEDIGYRYATQFFTAEKLSLFAAR